MGMCLFHEVLLFKIHFYTLFGNDKVNVYCEPPATIRVVNIIPILQMSKQVLKEVKQFAQSHTVSNGSEDLQTSCLTPKLIDTTASLLGFTSDF